MFEGQEIKIWLNFQKLTGGKEEIPVTTKDGILMSKDNREDLCAYYLKIDCDGFDIRMLSGYENPEFEKWKNELPFFIKYFRSMKKEDAQKLCLWANHFDFSLKRFYERRDMSEQSDYFLDHYEGWYYLNFDEIFDDLYFVPGFKEKSESHLIYRVSQYDSPDIYMFHKELTFEGMNRSFAQLLGLRKAAKELNTLLKNASKEYSLTEPWRYLE